MKYDDVVFLDVEAVEKLHDDALAVSGGAAGVRDRGLLESAVAAPAGAAFDTIMYSTIALMAAALAHGLARNHAFLDGNKRAAAMAAATFLQVNGFDVRFTAANWEDAFVNLAIGTLTLNDLAALIAHEMGRDVDVEL